jgi:hypothetical protein
MVYVFLWLGFQGKKGVGTVQMVENIRKTNIRPTQCYTTASFDFGNNDFKSNKIQLSQLKFFVDNNRPKHPPNLSITTHLNFDATYEAQPFYNGNDNVIEGERNENSATITGAQLDLETTEINSPPTNSTTLFNINNASSPR